MRCVLCVGGCVVCCVLSGVVCCLVLCGVACCVSLFAVLFVGLLYGCLSFVDRCEWLFDCGGLIAVCWMV